MISSSHSNAIARQIFRFAILAFKGKPTQHSRTGKIQNACQLKRPITTSSGSMAHSRPSSTTARAQSTKASGLHSTGQKDYGSSQCPVTGRPSAQKYTSTDARPEPATQRCYIAVGSNIGDRLRTIEQACIELDAKDGIKLRRTSSIWQTKAMYVEDQNDFLNGVLEAIEDSQGRTRTIDKGPRTLDLDILLYGDAIVQNDRLEIPHKLMLERAFVLQPLCELIPERTPPGSHSTRYASYLNQLSQNGNPMSTWVQVSQHSAPLTPLVSGRQTRLMSILNITPDSFSDGGVHSPSDLATLQLTIEKHISAGVSVIDVGGESTRPHAAPVTDSDEKSRVLPVIQLINSIRSASHGSHNRPAVSIDTYHASVARAAVEAGADIVNDVSAGTLDPSMLHTVASLGCTVILMHMRGNPLTMTSKEHTFYPNGLIETIGAELVCRVKAAEEAGIRRWRIVLDPGIGFAKTGEQNLELLRRFEDLRRFPGLQGMPWVVGASRKGFIGTVTGVKDAKERGWGTAAAVAASVQGGADMVRVHDVDEMSKVVKMADAIWRRGP